MKVSFEMKRNLLIMAIFILAYSNSLSASVKSGPVVSRGSVVWGNKKNKIHYTSYFWKHGKLVDFVDPSGNGPYRPWVNIGHRKITPKTFVQLKQLYTKSSYKCLDFMRLDLKRVNEMLKKKIAKTGPFKTFKYTVLMVVEWVQNKNEHRIIVYTAESNHEKIYKSLQKGSIPDIILSDGMTRVKNIWKLDLTLNPGPIADEIWAGRWKQFGAPSDIKHMSFVPVPPLEQMRRAKQKRQKSKSKEQTKASHPVSTQPTR